jgi:hypothetical protein
MIRKHARHAEPVHRQIAAVALSVYLASSCAPGLAQRAGADQEASTPKALAPGDSLGIPGTEYVITFETVAEDSRCPKGARCVWEGDAAVRIRIDAPRARASTYTLHTSERFGRTIEHDQVRVELTDLTPYPSTRRKTPPEDYRLRLQLHRK